LRKKLLELLKETVPEASRVGVLRYPTGPVSAASWTELQDAARVLGVELQSLEVQTPNDIDGAFEAATRGRVEALVVVRDEVIGAHLPRVVELAARNRLPSIDSFRDGPEAGSLMAYGPNLFAQRRRAAYYVDRILKGASPADLPVEQPREFDFIINLRTAEALGLTIPHYVLLQATEVIH
jgi:putative ABC transport system substrate-binding protein